MHIHVCSATLASIYFGGLSLIAKFNSRHILPLYILSMICSVLDLCRVTYYAEFLPKKARGVCITFIEVSLCTYMIYICE